MARKRLILEAKWSGALAIKGLDKLSNRIKRLSLGARSSNRNFRTLNKTLAQTGALSGGISAGALGGGRGGGGGGRGRAAGKGAGGKGGLLLGGGGRGLLPAVGGALVIRQAGRFLKTATIEAADFAQAMALVGLISGSTQKQVALMTIAAKRFAIESGKAPIEITDAFQALASGGLKTNQVISAANDVMKLATVRSGDVGVAAQLTALAIGLFNRAAEDSQEIVSNFATAVSKGKFVKNLNDLFELFKSGAGTAAALDGNLSDTLATLLTFSNALADNAVAGTSFRRMMALLAAKTPKVISGMKRLGIDMEDVNVKTKTATQIMLRFVEAELGVGEAAKIFGVKVGPNVAATVGILRKGTTDILAFAKAIRESTTGVADQHKILMATVRGELNRTSAVWAVFKEEFGRGLAPITIRGTKIARNLIQTVRGVEAPSKGVSALMATSPLASILTILSTLLAQKGKAALLEEAGLGGDIATGGNATTKNPTTITNINIDQAFLGSQSDIDSLGAGG